MSSNCDILVSAIKALRQRQQDASNFETYLKGRLPLYIDDRSLFDLPFESVVAVFSFPKKNPSRSAYHKFFEFAIHVIREVGPRASILFQTVDLALLTREEINELEGIPNLDWNVIRTQVFRSVTSFDEHRRFVVISTVIGCLSLIAFAVLGVALSTTNSRLRNFERRLGGVEYITTEGLADIEYRVSGIESTTKEGLIRVQHRLDGVESTAKENLTKLEHRVSGIDSIAHQHLTKIEKRVNGIEVKMTESLEAIAEDVEGVKSAGAGTGRNVANMWKYLNAPWWQKARDWFLGGDCQLPALE
jgi:hypothetical protein